jgi:type I restriction-modification system DNA methylase subunit
MPKTYTCKDCNKSFDQKSHYDAHKDKKIPCIFKDKPLKQVIEETVAKEVDKKIKSIKNKVPKYEIEPDIEPEIKQTKKLKKGKKDINLDIDYSYLRLPSNEIEYIYDSKNTNDKITPILKQVDKAHNILFQAESIVGQKALQIIMSLLFLKLIQPFLSDKPEEGKIDLLNKKHYEDKYTDDDVLEKIFGYFKDLKSLTKLPHKDIRNDTQNDAIKQMGEILKRHPITKRIYTESNFIKVHEATTIQTIINEVINKINFKEFEDNEDVIGEIYEHILNKYVKTKSKELGQFFTPRKLMKLIIHYKNDRLKKLFNKKKSISIYDSCMGTGGWIVTAYNMLKDNNYDINIAGGEVEPDTFQYGLMNLILTLKKFPSEDNIKCNSSLTHINKNKYNLITTNPPFNSKKQIKFNQIVSNFEKDEYTKKQSIKIDEIYKLKKDDPPIQFLELDYYKLEENGMCIIVLPYGDFFFGSSFQKTREYFMKEVNITDIILVPGGIFTHTGIKTCVLIFEKNKKGTECINISKINNDCTKIINITKLKIEDIKKESVFSWYHQDYLIDPIINELNIKMPSFEWIEFEKLFSLEKGQLQSSKVEEDENGDGVFINTSKIQNFKKITDTMYEGENIFITTFMPKGKTEDDSYIVLQYYNGKCSYSDLLSIMILNDEYKNKINKKYIYYLLKSIKLHIEKTYQKGACNKSLDQKNFNRMKLPIPSIEIQNNLVKTLDSSNEKVKYMKLIVENMKQDIDTFFELTIEIENRKKETRWINFDKVFTLEKGKLQSSTVEDDEEGEILFISKEELSNNTRKINIDNYYENGLFIANAFNGNGKCPIRFTEQKCIHSDLMLRLNINDEFKDIINIKYFYYFLEYIKDNIEYTYDKGSCNKSLDQKNFNRMKIQIPSIIQQNKCIEKINQMEEIINRWGTDIEDIMTNGSDKFIEYLEGEYITAGPAEK